MNTHKQGRAFLVAAVGLALAGPMAAGVQEPSPAGGDHRELVPTAPSSGGLAALLSRHDKLPPTAADRG